VSTLPDEEQHSASVGHIARGFGMGFFGQMLSRVVAYATQVALARMYGPVLFGFYTLGYTVVTIATLLASFGMPNTVVRYVAQYQSARDVSRTRGVIFLTLWASTALSLALSGLLFLGAGFLAVNVFNEPSLEIVFRVFSLAVTPFTVMTVALFATLGFQTVRPQTYVMEIGQPVMNLGLIIAFYLLGAQLLGAIAAYVISYAAGLVLALYYLKQVFPRLFDRNIPAKFESRELFSTSATMSIAYLTEYMNIWVPVLLLGIFISSESVGIFNVAARTAALSGVIYTAFSRIFSPMISDLYRRNALHDLSHLYKDVSRWIFTITSGLLLLAMLLSKDILTLFGDEFVAGWAVLVIIAGAGLFTCSIGITNHLLIMTGQQKIWTLATVASAVTGLIGCATLIPVYGMLGAAWAIASSLIVGSAISLVGVHRAMNFWPYNRLYLHSLVAGLLAAGVVSLMRSVLTLSEGVPAILVLTPLFMIVFIVVLLVLGPSPSDRQFLTAIITAVWRTIRGAT
jgi:O-antigen/teichoic acid export membrane protein